MVKIFMTIASVAFVTQVHAMEDDFEGMPLLTTQNPIKNYGTARLREIVIFNNQSEWPVTITAIVYAEIQFHPLHRMTPPIESLKWKFLKVK